MTFALVLWAVFIALMFVGWPILGKYSGASGAWVSTLVVAGSLVTTAAFSFTQLTSGPNFTTKGLILLLLAGAANGFAVYVYSNKAVDPTVPTGAFMVLIFLLMVVFTPVMDYAFNGTTFSGRQWLGMFTAALAVYLLRV